MYPESSDRNTWAFQRGADRRRAILGSTILEGDRIKTNRKGRSMPLGRYNHAIDV
jgi:hypothetical protein